MVMIEAVAILDTKLCKQITELARDTEPELLFNYFESGLFPALASDYPLSTEKRSKRAFQDYYFASCLD